MDGPDTTAGGPVPTPFHRMLSSKIVPGSGRGHRPADRQCDRRPYAATACRHLAAAGICRFRDTLEPFFQKHVDLDPCEMRSDATMHARAQDEVANIIAVEIDAVRTIDRLIIERSEEWRVGKGCYGTCSTRGSAEQSET